LLNPFVSLPYEYDPDQEELNMTMQKPVFLMEMTGGHYIELLGDDRKFK